MESFSQLAQWLEVHASEDHKRLHYNKKIMIEKLWNDDKNLLKFLPLEDLSVFSLDTTTVNKYGEITVNQERAILRQTSYPHKTRRESIYMFYEEGEAIFKEYRPYIDTNRPIPRNNFLKIKKINYV